MSILTVVTFGPVAQDLVGSIGRPLWEAFDLTIEFRGERALPAAAWDPARQQYSSEILLRELLTVERRGPAERMLGVTTVDLCIPMLSFVFGQAQLRGVAAVVSTARLDPAFYGLPPEADVVTRRLVKEALHEIGHTIGLIHCVQACCPMSLATTVGAIDAKGNDLCGGCATLAREYRRSDAVRGAHSIGQRKHDL